MRKDQNGAEWKPRVMRQSVTGKWILTKDLLEWRGGEQNLRNTPSPVNWKCIPVRFG